MAEPPSLTILALSIAADSETNVAALVSTVGMVAAAVGSAKPAKADAAMMITIAISETLLIALHFFITLLPNAYVRKMLRSIWR
jgi:hypothetical protein